MRRVAAGGTALDPEVVAQQRGPASPVGALTPREREVLALMAEGRANGAIAAALVMTEGAVERHVSSIVGTLGPAVASARAGRARLPGQRLSASARRVPARARPPRPQGPTSPTRRPNDVADGQ